MAVCCWCSQVSKRRFLSQLCILHRPIVRLRKVKKSKGTRLLWDLHLHNLIPKRKCCTWVWPGLQILCNDFLSKKHFIDFFKAKSTCLAQKLTVSKSRTGVLHQISSTRDDTDARYFLFFQHLHYLRSTCCPHFTGEHEYCVTSWVCSTTKSVLSTKTIPFLIISIWLCCESKTTQTYQSI